MESIQIEQMLRTDWNEVRDIYIQGIKTKNATFEKETPSWEEWDMKYLLDCRMVARVDKQIAGWVALTPYSSRAVYSGVAELSLYIHEAYRGKGIGTKLLASLINESEKVGFWTLQSGIFPDNGPSLALHKKFGFREVGKREKIGKIENTWRDVILLERRSGVVGMD
ncbi:N-acetyltransferase family protein [Evansella sp. AB-rgal1]|uniref:GNAT family N-acetyltransferase n=1 Tax=Evansella sp. AB-rgal1 TaxID=3242696 RepID=UPI00359D7E68